MPESRLRRSREVHTHHDPPVRELRHGRAYTMGGRPRRTDGRSRSATVLL